jgi:hypothetical protein
MAIDAGVHVLENNTALQLANISKPPLNERDRARGKGLNYPV